MTTEFPLHHIPGIGQAKQKCLAQLGIETVWQLLHYFPVRFDDRRVRPIDGLSTPTTVTVQAVVEGIPSLRWQGRRSLLRVPVRVDNRQLLNGLWFNQHYLRDKLTDGRIVRITGRLDPTKRTLVASHTELTAGQDPGALIPVYRVTKGLTSAELAKVIKKALDLYGAELEEILPRELLQKYRLCSHRDAVTWMHLASDAKQRRQAHRRLAFEEFFLFQLQLQVFRKTRQQFAVRTPLHINPEALERFRQFLPYPLTKAQVRACHEIFHDLDGSHPMVRLLQGDVGAGKTWVALSAAYAVTGAGEQTAFMAPTEILAEQHFHEATRYLQQQGVRVELLTGSTPLRDRARIKSALAAGNIDVMIGTHALITEDVQFAKLAFVIVDEQHRFGVSQRELLRDKGEDAHLLLMSATPIPRTLALAVYGDLDISTLDELPAGRKPVQTRVIRMSDEQRMILHVRRLIAKGQQAYVVAPLIEESEANQDLQSATELEKHLSEEFAGFRVALLHGKLSAAEKDSIMRAFARAEIQVLVSTTVIEVGINVQNATAMVIYNAERFGLAQLHQLRGRVGRGQDKSFCYLISDVSGGVASERLQTLVDSEDGFFIAERDLELRGPGEFLGVRQSGLPEFSVGDVVHDLNVMEVARQEATELLSQSDFWLLPKYAPLRAACVAATTGPAS